MGKTLKKVSSVAISAVTVISLSGASLLVPASALAQTLTIEQLLQQIEALRAQLAVLTGASVATPAGACSFTRDLTVGARGDDVKCLQTYLTSTGHFTFSGGATGYLGSVTKAAVAAWQAANGVSPAAGYFGAKSRAKYAGVAGAAPTAPGAPVVVPGAGLSVMAAATQPARSAIAGAGQIDVAKWVFTASAVGGVTVSDLQISRTGVVSDTNISNLYLADEQGVVFAQYSSLASGVAKFLNANFTVGAGQSRTVTLRLDLSSSASAGNTLGFRLDGVTLAGGGPVSGLPVPGPDLTVTTVSNPSLAAITHSVTNGARTVDAGTTGFMAHAASLIVTNSAVLLKSVKYTIVGSAAKKDLTNWKFKLNGVEVASVATVGNNDALTIVPAQEVRVNTGTTVLELYVDVMGSPNRNFEVQLLRPFELVALDTQYNSLITATLTDADSGSDVDTITINTGRITVNKASDTPTGNVARGATGITVAKYNVYAGGEPVKVRYLDLQLDKVSGAAWTTAANADLNIDNIRIVDDVGGQLGNTITSVVSGTGNGQCTLDSANRITCHFGSATSYINYIVPANTTRVLSAILDVLSGSSADITSIQASLPALTSNLEGQISFQTASSGSANGNIMTIVSTPLTIAASSAVGTQTYVAGAVNAKIAAFVLTASSAEGIKINSLTFNKDDDGSYGSDTMDLQNLKIMIGSTQFGTTQAIIGNTETSMAFSGSAPVLVPVGGSLNVDVFADVLTSSTAGTKTSVIDIIGCSSVGALSNSSITCPSTSSAQTAGQSVTIVAAAALTMAQDSDDPPANYVTMSSTGNDLFKLRFSVDDTEDVRVTEVNFRDTLTGTTAAGRFSLTNLSLYDGNTVLAGPVNITAGSDNLTTGTITFAMGSASPLLIRKNTSKTVTVRGDVTSITAGAVSNQIHTVSIPATTSVRAFGSQSSTELTTTVTGTPAGRAHTVFRTKPSISSSVLGAVSNRIRAATDEIATLNWGAASSADVIIGTVSISFAGAAVSLGAGTSNFAVRLIDASTNSDWGSSASQNCAPGGVATAGVSCGISFAPLALVSAGSTKSVKLRINSSNLGNTSQQLDGLSATVTTSAGILWTDWRNQTDSGITSNIVWEAVQIPITLVNVAYE